MKIVETFRLDQSFFFVMQRSSDLDIRINIEINDMKMYIIYRDTMYYVIGSCVP